MKSIGDIVGREIVWRKQTVDETILAESGKRATATIYY